MELKNGSYLIRECYSAITVVKQAHEIFLFIIYTVNRQTNRDFRNGVLNIDRYIETNNLILHSGGMDDRDDLYRNLWSKADVFSYMFKNPCADVSMGHRRTEAYVEMHQEVATEFFVYEKKTNHAIGIAGIKELRPKCWTITDIAIGSEFQGQGYGKQIVFALLSPAFDNYGAVEVSYDCFSKNEISKQLALSCGFNYSHSEQAEIKKNGEDVILDYYVIRKEI